MHEIVVEPRGEGLFLARYGDRILRKSTRQPLLDCARVLLREGADPKAMIEMRHHGSDHVAMKAPIWAAAKLTVAERDASYGPVFEPWKARTAPAGEGYS